MFNHRQDFLTRFARHAVEPEGPYDALRRHDLAILAAKPLLAPVGHADDVTPLAARAEGHLANRPGGAGGGPPAKPAWGGRVAPASGECAPACCVPRRPNGAAR